MKASELVMHLRKKGSEANRRGMKKFGINVSNATGVSVTDLRRLGRNIGDNQSLSLELWETGLHEARILAAIIGDPRKVTVRQMEEWVSGFDSWDVCDQVCGNLFDKTPFAYDKAFEWSRRGEEYVKRAGFVLMAGLSVHDKASGRSRFEKFFPVIVREAKGGRNYVKKAVNWALRQIGKRSLHLNRQAIAICRQIAAIDSPSAKWIASNALRELESEAVQKRL